MAGPETGARAETHCAHICALTLSGGSAGAVGREGEWRAGPVPRGIVEALVTGTTLVTPHSTVDGYAICDAYPYGERVWASKNLQCAKTR